MDVLPILRRKIGFAHNVGESRSTLLQKHRMMLLHIWFSLCRRN